MGKERFYVSIIFSEKGSKSVKLGNHIDNLADNYETAGRGDPNVGLLNHTTLERELSAYVFYESKEAVEFSGKLLGLEGVEELRLGSYIRK